MVQEARLITMNRPKQQTTPKNWISTNLNKADHHLIISSLRSQPRKFSPSYMKSNCLKSLLHSQYYQRHLLNTSFKKVDKLVVEDGLHLLISQTIDRNELSPLWGGATNFLFQVKYKLWVRKSMIKLSQLTMRKKYFTKSNYNLNHKRSYLNPKLEPDHQINWSRLKSFFKCGRNKVHHKIRKARVGRG